VKKLIETRNIAARWKRDRVSYIFSYGNIFNVGVTTPRSWRYLSYIYLLQKNMNLLEDEFGSN
jgi:hypothetical protein